VDIKQLENLIALVEEGSVREAALRQHISQPGLSMSIKRLEEDLKVALFRREGRRIRPTEHCLEFYQRAKLALAQLRTGRADLAGAENISLRFGIGETRNDQFIGNLTAGLIDSFPSIRLEFFEQRYSQLLPRVANGDIDAAFFGAPRNAIPHSLEVISLHITRMCVACRASHPLTHSKRALTDHELLKANWVTSRRWPPHLISREGQPFNVPIVVDSLQAVRQVVQSVDYLTVLPEGVIERELSEGSLVKLPSRRFSYEVEILAVRRRNFPSRVLDAAIEIARSSFQ
jgi:DNA-binding transcriptional LysR family regulator